MNKLSTIDCGHFDACSGCTINDVNPSVWEEIQAFSPQFTELRVGAITGWRTRAKLAIRGANEIGLFRARSHEVVPIPHCKIHHPSINRAVALLKDSIDISIYNEKTGSGLLRYIQCHVDLETAKVQLTLVVQKTDVTVYRLCESLKKQDLWHSIWLNIQPAATNTILGAHWERISGPSFLQQKLAGHSFLFHPGAFAQAHWTLFEQLALDVVDWIPAGANLLEIYAGVGVMGTLAAPKCASVAFVENNPFAHQSYRGAFPYHLGDAKAAIALLPNFDCVIVDPPRKGIDPELLDALKTFSGTIIYVSCDFNSYVRDASELMDAGWEIKQGRGYLLFPGTNHVETVSLLAK